MPPPTLAVEELQLPFPPAEAPGQAAVAPACPGQWNPFGTFDECPICTGEMAPEHAHFRCTSCGWRDSCCD